MNTEESKKSTSFNELKTLNSYYIKLDSERTQGVINNSMLYYVTRARMYKLLFVGLSAGLLAINCSIPVVNQMQFKGGGIWITLLSSVAAFISGLITLIGLRDKWFRYRTVAENLKTECNLYNSNSGKYRELSDAGKQDLLIQRFEEINGTDIQMWQNELANETSKPDDDKDKHDKISPSVPKGIAQ